jgi:hypothetical protein
MEHVLKIYRQYYQAVIDGRKTFEVRHDDRGFQAGDTVRLRELIEHDDSYTGREARADIGYVTGFSQKEGFVVFSLLNLSVISS